MPCCLACACCFETCCGEQVDQCHRWWSCRVCFGKSCHDQCCRHHLASFDCCPACGADARIADQPNAVPPTMDNTTYCSRWRRLLMMGSTVLCFGLAPSCGLAAIGLAECAHGALVCCTESGTGRAHMVTGWRTCLYGCLNLIVCCVLLRRISHNTCTWCFLPGTRFDATPTAEEASRLEPLGVLPPPPPPQHRMGN